MRIKELLESVNSKPYHYVGNCANSFDSDTGECNIGIFSDVSDFAVQDENAMELSKEEFETYANVPTQLNQLTQSYQKKYLAYDNGLLVLYVEPVWDDETNDKDPNSDIHYFFAK
jgi:hypothetical protein